MSRDPREIAQRIQKTLHANLVSNGWRDTPEFQDGELLVIESILAAEMPRWVPGRAKEFWLTLPHCCGYPKCDGDLEGELHSGECPLYQKIEMTKFEFAEAYAKWLQETP